MHNSSNHTRSSTDLGRQPTKPLLEVPHRSVLPSRTQPPRLQHSPSLPNIWFPPHSGPLPPRCLNGAEDPLCRPVTPPARVIKVAKPMTTTSLSHAEKPPKNGSTNCENTHAHVLLTPPLTPSSSIRTTTSQESVSSRPQETSASSEACDLDQPTSITTTSGAKFLLVFVEPDEAKAVRESETKRIDGPDGISGIRRVNESMVRALLGTFGSLRQFLFTEEAKEKASEQVFQVEFYDIRATQAACAALEGRTLYGLNVVIRGREVAEAIFTIDCNSPNSQSNAPAIIPPVVEQGTLGKGNPPPLASPIEQITRLTQIGQAGLHSHLRERHIPRGDSTKHRHRSSSIVSHVTSVAALVLPPSSSSPTFFYSSTPTTNDSHTISKQPPHADFGKKHLSPGHDAATSLIHGSTVPEVPTTHPWMGPLALASPSVPHFQGHSDPYFFPALAMPSIAPPTGSFDAHAFAIVPPIGAVPSYYPQMLSPHATMPLSPPASVIYDCEFRGHPTYMANWTQEHGIPTSPVPRDFYGQDHHAYTQGVPPPFHIYHPGPFVPFFPGPIPPETGNMLERQVSHASLHAAPAISTPLTAINRDPAAINERNQLNIARIEDGQDTRTTTMIKNIPNKMTDKDLINFIANVTPRKIDFIYLRMDFQNGCNVGYAFVNFIYVQDLLKFAKAKLGERWNMFSSDKVLQMSYANYQGKEALVEKFKNSCIMDEREAWRPKIFYSELGPEQGLPQPFPAPTHLRRKERSSHNRGALYVPGVNGGNSAHHLVNHSSRRHHQQHDEGSQSVRRGKSWV